MKAPCAGMQGKMLPSVTTEDNGDVLTVVDGEWSKASGGVGGDDSMRVTFTMGESIEDVSCDKTYVEITSAIINENVSFAFVIPTMDVVVQTDVCAFIDGSIFAIFMQYNKGVSPNMAVMPIEMKSDNTIEVVQHTIQFV